ncbi:dihydrofolate reductase family protein [Algoriphagus halophilus]|uniref:dihydrofolate reductase family protein n=1 Tax=Algoriphagus halophilus TaxID=226505 RepID=UPI00358EF4AD
MDYWPSINVVTKYVYSKTVQNSDWENTVFLQLVEELKNLKIQEVEQSDAKSQDIQVWGSSELIQVLLTNDLVDELWLMIHPLTLGIGKKLFKGGAIPAAFHLESCTVTQSGVILAQYQRKGKVKTGTFRD